MPGDGDTKYNGGKVTLREFDQWREDHLRSHDQWMRDHMEAHRLEASRIEALLDALGIRVDHTNEWRNEELEDRHLFVTKSIYDKDVDHLTGAVLSIGKDQSGTDGKLTALLIAAPIALTLTFGALAGLIFLVSP